MEPIYDTLEPEQATEIEQLARVMYEAREHRRQILEQYHTDEPADVLARVAALAASGESEHPIYEHYLAVCVLDGTRSAARTLMAARLKDEEADLELPASPHLLLNEALEQFGSTLLGAPRVLRQDALLLTLRNGVEMTIHYPSNAEYSLRWRTADGVELGIDTAPGHRHIDTGPHHLHRADGKVVDDPLTRPGLPPWQNLRAVIDAVLDDPLLSALQ
jgi:hypothetical protein